MRIEPTMAITGIIRNLIPDAEARTDPMAANTPAFQTANKRSPLQLGVLWVSALRKPGIDLVHLMMGIVWIKALPPAFLKDLE